MDKDKYELKILKDLNNTTFKRHNFNNIEIDNIIKISDELWKKSRKEYIDDIKYIIPKKIHKDSKEYKKINNIKNIKEESAEGLYKYAIEFRKDHSKLVADIAIKIFDNNFNEWMRDFELATNCYERKILYFACLIHDIKKFDKSHHKKGAEWFRDTIETYLVIDKKAIDDIYILIKKHDKESKIEKDVDKKIKLIILIIRMADELSKYCNE